MVTIFKSIFKGLHDSKKGKRSHWRYEDLQSTPYLYEPVYLFNLAKDASKRKNKRDMILLIRYLKRHKATQGSFRDVIQYLRKALRAS